MNQLAIRGRAPAERELGQSLCRWHRETRARRRDYSPPLGRFIERDPIGFEAGDNNWYRFVANGPTNYADPLGLLKISIGGYVFYVHKNDPDPFPSRPHGHVGAPTSRIKVNVETGELFQGTMATGRNIGKKTLAALRQRLRGAGLLGVAAIVVMEAPSLVQAAEGGGVGGVASYTSDLAVQTAVATCETAAIGGAVIAGASLAGTSVTTASGAALAGLGGAATVGCVVTLGAGVGGAVGYGIGSIPIGSHTIHEHLGEGMYWAGQGMYVGGAAVGNAASSAWNWITDW
jgi:RHS repeat-associated protein